jgi:hypothetical protein
MALESSEMQGLIILHGRDTIDRIQLQWLGTYNPKPRPLTTMPNTAMV